MRALTPALALVLVLAAATAARADPETAPSRVIVTETKIEIFQPVTFAPNSDAITAGSYRTLDAYAATLVGNPEILMVEIRGHTDVAESPRLGLQRARAVLRYLSTKGVFPLRMHASSAGSLNPDRGIDLRIVQRSL